MTLHPDQLSAKVHAVNTAGAFANTFFPAIVDLLNKHVGKKIIKRTPWNDFTKAFKLELEATYAGTLAKPEGVSFSSSIYDTFVVFSVTARGAYKWHPDDVYTRDEEHKVEFYFSITPEGAVKRESKMTSFHRTDWTVNEVTQLCAAREQKAAELRAAEEALGPFRRN